jgi:two-component system sensor histidine kinase/response regulator
MSNKEISIMLIDDNRIDLFIHNEFIKQMGIASSVSEYGFANDALMFLKNQSINLIILDIFMPDINGYEIYEQVKSSVNLNHIPIIFISYLNDSESKVKSLNLGANDYITKPFNLQELLLRVAYHISCHKRELAKIREIEECKKTIEILLAEVSNNKKGNQE